MADFSVAYIWTMQGVPFSEDPRLEYEDVADNIGRAISGINSIEWPEDYARILAIPQAQRGPAVEAFYQSKFWNQWLAQVASDELAKRFFDCGVNEGRGTATKIIQESVNVVLRNPPFIAEDGIWGPATLAAVNAADPTALKTVFIEGRCARYDEIAQANPADEKYLSEWLARAQA